MMPPRPNLFSEDDICAALQASRFSGLPLIKQGRLTGLLYLENTLTSYAFPPDRIADPGTAGGAGRRFSLEKHPSLQSISANERRGSAVWSTQHHRDLHPGITKGGFWMQ